MARHRSNRSIPRTISHRPGQYSRSTYRQLYRQPRPGTHERPVRIRQRRARQLIRRSQVYNPYRPALRPHGVLTRSHDVGAGFPGVFWWRQG